MDTLIALDKELLLLLNGSHSLFLDGLVKTLTTAATWIPLYLALFYLVLKNNDTAQKVLLIVACAGACVVLDTMDDEFLASVRAKSEYIRSELSQMKKVTGLDGLGLMIGIDLDGMTGAEAVSQLMEEGVLAIPAGERLRLLPPLTISKDEIEQALKAMRKVLD
jgi:hypothetical protein